MVSAVAAIVVLFSVALGFGVYSFNSAPGTSTVSAEVATMKNVDAKPIQKSENIITKLGTSPVDKAIAKAYADKKVKAKELAVKKAKAKAKAKKAKAKKAKMMSKFKKLGTYLPFVNGGKTPKGDDIQMKRWLNILMKKMPL